MTTAPNLLHDRLKAATDELLRRLAENANGLKILDENTQLRRENIRLTNALRHAEDAIARQSTDIKRLTGLLDKLQAVNAFVKGDAHIEIRMHHNQELSATIVDEPDPYPNE